MTGHGLRIVSRSEAAVTRPRTGRQDIAAALIARSATQEATQ